MGSFIEIGVMSYIYFWLDVFLVGDWLWGWGDLLKYGYILF